MTSSDSSIATKPTSDVAGAGPFTGTSNILDGKGSSGASSGSAAGASAPGMFDKDGAIGKQFTTSGALGGTAQAIGGPFDKDGAIGKAFTTDGAIGGAAQNNLGSGK